jgi:hypothetical protein
LESETQGDTGQSATTCHAELNTAASEVMLLADSKEIEDAAWELQHRTIGLPFLDPDLKGPPRDWVVALSVFENRAYESAHAPVVSLFGSHSASPLLPLLLFS